MWRSIRRRDAYPMTRPSDVLKRRRTAVLTIIAAHRGLNPRVFGSVARGTDTPDSDVDILVDVPTGTGLLSLGAMQYELEHSLGVRVDVLTIGDLPGHLRDSVIREARPL